MSRLTQQAKVISVSFLFLMCLGAKAFAADDFQHWAETLWKVYSNEHVDLSTFTDVRFAEDASIAKLYLFAEQFTWHARKNLDLGLEYMYLDVRATSPDAVDDDYKWQHRISPQINPHWALTDWLKLHVRNKCEFRWIENNGSYNTRFRQRWTFTVPVKNKGPFTSVYANGELFYNFAEHELNENRMVPFGFDFKLTDRTAFKVYYMIQSTKGADDWSSNQIIGTLLTVKL